MKMGHEKYRCGATIKRGGGGGRGGDTCWFLEMFALTRFRNRRSTSAGKREEGKNGNSSPSGRQISFRGSCETPNYYYCGKSPRFYCSHEHYNIYYWLIAHRLLPVAPRSTFVSHIFRDSRENVRNGRRYPNPLFSLLSFDSNLDIETFVCWFPNNNSGALSSVTEGNE